MSNFETLTTDNAMPYLSAVASTLEPRFAHLVNVIFADPNFERAPGGSKHHHNYLGGLALHTAEVVRNCLMLSGTQFNQDSLELSSATDSINLDVLLVAAFLHDYCKTIEYEWEVELVDAPGQEQMPDEFARLQVPRIKEGTLKYGDYVNRIGHVTGSAMVFHMNAMNYTPAPGEREAWFNFINNVMHVMLSHHGRKEWGSPVEPRTPEAYILHSADMLSSRGA